MDSNPECFSCAIVNQYVDLAGRFTEDLSRDLVGPMWAMFGALAALWVVVQGIRIILATLDLRQFGQELIYMVIAAGLMAGQGPSLVNAVYTASLTTMSGGAASVLTTGAVGRHTVSLEHAPETTASSIANLEGMTALVWTAENGIYEVFKMAALIAAEGGVMSAKGIGAFVYALLLFIPYLLLMIVYAAQVVVSIFRIMMLAALSPILMLMFGFNFGRAMVWTALRTLFAAFMVLYGVTVALAVCLYGVQALGVADAAADENIRSLLSLDNPTLWVAMILGWMGTAFMAEATAIANSVAGSHLTNTAAGIITAGVSATGLGALKAARDRAPSLGQALGAGGKATAVAASASHQAIRAAAQAVRTRLSTPTFDR
ncbi:hypothetical protein [Roseospira visakhapatnamensis]|uniref:Type IV secretion system protein TrbL n=1 Tax=Roseospira visakhapatnamensis TaxID=390880 RepID=A0A7W6RFR8_9PROT|nr:hypothetical protein [Roseospira visakhapatnamensis]MBB4267637.1 type IV secretion system protein TrbL [Roseospira visakhapatnamensis]